LLVSKHLPALAGFLQGYEQAPIKKEDNMGRNVFLKSVIRQPIRTLVLVFLICVAAFAFVARAAEFVIVDQELNRLERLFSSIGVLSARNPSNFTVDHDVRQAAQVVAESQYIIFDDRRVFTQGVLHDLLNLSTSFTPGVPFMTPEFEIPGMSAMDHYIVASVLMEPTLVVHRAMPALMVILHVDEMYAGDPQFLFVGTREFVNDFGQTAIISARQEFFIRITEDEAERFRRGEFNPFSIRMGYSYLFRTTPWSPPIPWSADDHRVTWYIRPFDGDDGLGVRMVEDANWAGVYRPIPALFHERREENLNFYQSVNNEEENPPSYIDYSFTIKQVDSPTIIL